MSTWNELKFPQIRTGASFQEVTRTFQEFNIRIKQFLKDINARTVVHWNLDDSAVMEAADYAASIVMKLALADDVLTVSYDLVSEITAAYVPYTGEIGRAHV